MTGGWQGINDELLSGNLTWLVNIAIYRAFSYLKKVVFRNYDSYASLPEGNTHVKWKMKMVKMKPGPTTTYTIMAQPKKNMEDQKLQREVVQGDA